MTETHAAEAATVLTVPLYRLAHSRTGDKGNRSNLSVIAWHPASAISPLTPNASRSPSNKSTGTAPKGSFQTPIIFCWWQALFHVSLFALEAHQSLPLGKSTKGQ